MSQSDDAPETPTTPPADTPPAPPAAPPTSPAAPAPTPHHGGGSDDGDRLGALEKIVGNLSDAFTGLTDAIANGSHKEEAPEKMPWTHWGSRKKD